MVLVEIKVHQLCFWWRLKCKEKHMAAGMVTLGLREQGFGLVGEQCTEHPMPQEMLSSPSVGAQDMDITGASLVLPSSLAHFCVLHKAPVYTNVQL